MLANRRILAVVLTALLGVLGFGMQSAAGVERSAVVTLDCQPVATQSIRQATPPSQPADELAVERSHQRAGVTAKVMRIAAAPTLGFSVPALAPAGRRALPTDTSVIAAAHLPARDSRAPPGL